MQASPELAKIHPLGKSPIVTVTPPGASEPIVLAESGFMTQYLCDHYPEGQRLTPTRWKDGMEGKIGGETEAWMRNQYFLHYCEGSLMPILVMTLVIARTSFSFPVAEICSGNNNSLHSKPLTRILPLELKSTNVPFLVRPITSSVANRIFASYIFPNAKKHLQLVDQQLQTSSGKYLCCDHLTAADIIMSFPLIAAKNRFDSMGRFEGGSWKNEFPRVYEYVQLLEAEEGYKRSVAKIEELDGKFEAAL